MRIHEIGVTVFSPCSPMLGDRASPDKVCRAVLFISSSFTRDKNQVKF